MFIPVIVLVMACQNNTTPKPEFNQVKPLPIDSTAKVDSILKLNYNKATYDATMNELARWDSCLARQIDSSMQYVVNLPIKWKAKKAKMEAMDTLAYSKLLVYTNQIAKDYYTYDSIKKVKPLKPILPIAAAKKPVIYIYPTTEQKTTVYLDFYGTDLYTWPKIDKTNTWEITAQPDGMLTDSNGEQYPYLFWEGSINNTDYIDINEGFVVSADNTEQFFLEKLKLLGLNTKEYTDFITFWAPQMHKNKYNFIRFETTNYSKDIPLTIIPKPESMQRILMVYKPVDADYKAKPQSLQPFKRKGYTVIEWGGMEFNDRIN
jgi:hypothetical protein